MEATMGNTQTFGSNGAEYMVIPVAGLGTTRPEWVITVATPEIAMVLITPEMALFWLQSYRYGGQRQSRGYHVKELADVMLEGEFEENLISFRVFEGRAWMVNGYHTLNGIVESQKPQYLPVRCKQVNSQREVENAYGHIDQGLKRSATDCAPMERFEREFNLSRGDVKYIGQAAPFILSGFDCPLSWRERTRCRSIDARNRFIESWAETGTKYLNLLGGSENGNGVVLRRAAVVAVALVTIRHSDRLALEFWQAVAGDDRLDNGSPEHALIRFLTKNAALTNNKTFQYCKMVARCWNAKAEGRTIGQLKPVGGSVRIVGTPYEITS